MNRSIIFSNTALNIKKLEKLIKILDNNDNIKKSYFTLSFILRKTINNNSKIVKGKWRLKWELFIT